MKADPNLEYPDGATGEGLLDPPSACWADPILEDVVIDTRYPNRPPYTAQTHPQFWASNAPDDSLAILWAAHVNARRNADNADPEDNLTRVNCTLASEGLYRRVVAALKTRPGVMVQVESDLAIWWSVRNNRVEQRAVCDGREVRA